MRSEIDSLVIELVRRTIDANFLFGPVAANADGFRATVAFMTKENKTAVRELKSSDRERLEHDRWALVIGISKYGRAQFGSCRTEDGLIEAAERLWGVKIELPPVASSERSTRAA